MKIKQGDYFIINHTGDKKKLFVFGVYKHLFNIGNKYQVHIVNENGFYIKSFVVNKKWFKKYKALLRYVGKKPPIEKD